MTGKWLYIMDYSTCDIYSVDITGKNWTDEEIESFITLIGFDIDCVSYMICNKLIQSITNLIKKGDFWLCKSY